MDATDIKNQVKKHYGSIAAQSGATLTSDNAQGSCCGNTGSQSSCCSPGEVLIDLSNEILVNYGPLDADLPEGANLGLGCGLPTLHAQFQPGETVLDLGSGAGIDVFLAARAVGAQGRAIGVDMTPEMIARAQENALKGGYTNVDFRQGEIEDLPVESASVDVVISNCVINLVPDKRRAFLEIHRVLRPGGRFSISDIVIDGQMPDSARQDAELWSACVAGALQRQAYLDLLKEAGFTEVQVIQSVEFDSLPGASYRTASITVQGRKA